VASLRIRAILWNAVAAIGGHAAARASNSDDLPDPSFNSLPFELETGDSATSSLAALALRQLADSAGALVPRLEPVLWSGDARWRREGACFILGSWSPTDRVARVAILRALDRGDAETRLLVLSTDYYRADGKLQARMFEHREDPNLEVRAAVFERARGLLSSPYPPIRGFTDALRDPSRRVRLATIRALRSTPREHRRQVMAALDLYRHDLDREVASLASEVRAELMMGTP